MRIVTRQVAAILADGKDEKKAIVQECQDTRRLLSSAWGYFYYRLNNANFSSSLLWFDLSQVEWLIRKMGQWRKIGCLTLCQSNEN